MPTPLRVLILEDEQSDAELMLHTLRRAGFEPIWQKAGTESEYLELLAPDLDVVLADYTLPQFNALHALRLLKERGLDIPFIVVTGTISEEVAVECMKEGAADYLLKDRLTRLGPAVIRALEEKGVRVGRRQAEERIRHQLERLAALRDIDLAITSSLDLRVTLGVLLDQVTERLRVDAAAVLLLNQHTQMLEFAAGRGFRTRGLSGSRLRLGE
ncbi:MAG: response regulator, partial [Armatimonadetes bacterium]|nr:response regulator [Armatimonadota bacterium]